MTYDASNIFAKILAGDIPSRKVFESDICVAFYDISPRAKVHVLVIPKGRYVDYLDFVLTASSDVVSEFFLEVGRIASEVLKLRDFRLQANNGTKAGQEVFHFHMHIISDEQIEET